MPEQVKTVEGNGNNNNSKDNTNNANKKATDDSTELREWYEKNLLTAGVLTDGAEEEIIDIISDFPWSAHSLTSNQNKSDAITFNHNLPFCYAIERRQTIASNVASMINLLLGGINATTAAFSRGAQAGALTLDQLNKKVTDAQKANDKTANAQNNQKDSEKAKSQKQTPSKTATAAGKSAQSMGDFLKNTSNFINTVGTWLTESITNATEAQISEGNLQTSKFLSPWKWLYFTKITKKRYVFPTFGANDLFGVNSSWGKSETKNNPLSSILQIIQQGAEMAYGISQFVEMLPGTSGSESRFEMFNIESAKGFNYNADNCPEVDVAFPLFNTTKRDAWKKNYRFILMFILRNLPLRTSLYSFMPPLLYDILIPGVKHLPLCYVSNVTVRSEGHVRVMKCDSLIKSLGSSVNEGQTATNNSNTATQGAQDLVPVPEAWSVGIKFKCLIPDTMNLILSTADFPINISQAE